MVVGSARNWAHYINLTVSGGMLLMIYGVLCRFALLMPLALSHLALSVWLMVKGFAERPAPALPGEMA